MSLTAMLSRLAIIVAALAALLPVPPGALAADVVVVDARGVDLKPGQAIDGAQKLTLKAGQQVTLISPAGKTMKLRGPYDDAPLGGAADAAPDVAAALSALVTQNLARSDKVGVVRGGGNDVVPPEPYLLDVTHVGTRCLREDTPIVFWRPGAGPATKLVVTPYDRSWRARAEWPAGLDRIMMPPTLPLHSRTTYIVHLGDKENAITLVAIPAAATNDAMRAAWMMDAGCDTQAQALLRAGK
jgi:hypothetical protein